MRALVLALVLAGCGGLDAGPFGNPDANLGDGGANDAPPGCFISVSYNPAMPIADPVLPIHATAIVNGASGVFPYNWSVFLSGNPVAFTYAQPADRSQIDFLAPTMGSYEVRLDIGGAGGCAPYDDFLNVAAPGANIADYRLRVVPTPGGPPPQESIIQVQGGAPFHRSISLDPGIAETLTIQNGTTGIPAYVRFAPTATPYAFVEGFSATDGTVQLQLLGQPHDVLVVPSVPGVAPALLPWSPGTTALTLGPGTTVMGSVKGPSGSALAGATVQLTSGGVPSTLATTDGSGNFTIHAAFTSGAQVTAQVTPPLDSGLPVLQATAAFTLSTMTIRYAAGLQTCDLAATPVKRSNVAQPNAQVTVVGTLAAVAGTVTAVAAANATGTVRIAASADGTGKLPSVLVPRAPLQAIVQLGAGDLALSSIDTSTCAVLTINAPAMTLVGGVVKSPTNTLLHGVSVEAMPTGALAGLPPVTARSGSGGGYSLALATGGHYDVRFVDPSGTGAPVVLLDVTTVGIPATVALLPSLLISGAVNVAADPNPVVGASVQVLCATCTGIDAARPLAQCATDSTGQFSLAVPDPGTM